MHERPRSTPMPSAPESGSSRPELQQVDDGGGGDLQAAAFIEALRAAGGSSAGETLQEILRLVLLTGGWDAASITELHPDGRLDSTASVGTGIQGYADLQYPIDQGPAVDAARTQVTVQAPDLIGERRWAKWTPLATAAGVLACLSVPLHTDKPLGALTVYSHQSRLFTDRDRQASQTAGAHAAVALVHAQVERHLWRAVEARNRTGQAQGILMERYGLTPDAAFELLNRISQTTNTKLAAVAEQLISTGALPHLGPSAHGA